MDLMKKGTKDIYIKFSFRFSFFAVVLVVALESDHDPPGQVGYKFECYFSNIRYSRHLLPG